MKNTSRLSPLLFGRWWIPLALAGSLLGGLALGCDHDDRRGDEGMRRDDSGWHDHGDSAIADTCDVVERSSQSGSDCESFSSRIRK